MPNTLHKRDVRRMADIQRGRCIRCGNALNMSRGLDPNNRDSLSVDHVIPICGGGLDQIGNLIILHRKCNGAKANSQATGCERIWAGVIADAIPPTWQFAWIPAYRI